MSRTAILLALTLTLPAGGCMMKPRHLVYADGVKFIGWHVPKFEICLWEVDPKNPQPCPLVVHLPAGDVGAKDLADAAALKRAGWEQQDNSDGSTTLLFRSRKSLVVCSHRGGALRGVSVGVLPGDGGGPIDASVSGKRVTLPNTDEAITAALGQPLRRE
jgi:hypothetical protein